MKSCWIVLIIEGTGGGKHIRIRNGQTKRKYFPSLFQMDKLYLVFIDSKNIMSLSIEITTQGCKRHARHR